MTAPGRRTIVDAHHHLWDLGACHYPWLMAQGVERFFGDPTAIQKNYLVEDLRKDAADYELTGSVHVQVGAADGQEIAETDWLETCARREGLPSAIVAFCDLASADAPAILDRQARRPHVRGIRQIIGRSVDEDRLTGSGALVDNRLWRDNFRRLADYDLSFDLQLIPSQTPHVAAVLAELPPVPIALCHCGSPWDQTDEGIESWRRGLTELARLPNLVCKLSGFGMFDHDWTTASVRTLVESCIGIFGVDRCMFGSNFPVEKLRRGYGELWRTYEAVVGGYDESAQRLLFGEVARSFYRLSA